jgi:hypothetical protein
MTVEVLVPFVVSAPDATGGRQVSSLPAGATFACAALVDNGKARAGQLLTALGEELRDQGVVRDFFVYRKPGGLVPMEAAERDELVGRADLVISGVGDCGGCTASTVNDAQTCGDRGVPTFTVVTTTFEGLARSVVEQRDGADPGVLVVDHPIWTRSPDWFAATAKQLALEIVGPPA